MADLVITAANVLAGSNASSENGVAGEAISQGKAVYKSSTTSKWMLADSNSATAEARTATGIALCAASTNQPVVVQKSGDITIGATLVAGSAYYLSETPGGIQPAADLGSGENVCQLGIATTTAVLRLAIQNPGVML